MDLYIIDECQKPVANVVPDKVALLKHTSEIAQIWPRPDSRKRGRRGRVSTTNPEWDLLLHGTQGKQVGSAQPKQKRSGPTRAELEQAGASVQELDREESETKAASDEEKEDDSDQRSSEMDDSDARMSDLDTVVIEAEVAEVLASQQEQRKVEPVEAEAAASEPTQALLPAQPAEVQQLHPEDVPPPPPALPKAKGRAAGVRQRAFSSLILEHGRITYYVNKNAFEATCNNPSHGLSGACVLSRTANGRRRGNRIAGGRPVAFLAAWLQLGAQCNSKEEHWDRARWQEHLSHANRSSVRAALKDRAFGPILMAHERPREEDEDEEPATLEGLL